MQSLHYGKGLIYHRPIFWLTKLAFLRARAVQRENILIAITVPLNKTYFGKKYQETKNSGISTPSTDTSRLSRDLYRSSQIPTRQCQNPPSGLLCFHGWSNKMKIKILKTPSTSSKKLNELNNFLLFC